MNKETSPPNSVARRMLAIRPSSDPAESELLVEPSEFWRVMEKHLTGGESFNVRAIDFDEDELSGFTDDDGDWP